MLEKVDLNKSVDKENYKKLREEMDVKLGELQRACKEEKIPVVIVFLSCQKFFVEGVAASGIKG